MGGVRQALNDGPRLVGKTWRLALLAYGLSLALALPLAALMRQHLAASLGRSLAATRLRQGWDDLWFQGFEARAKGIASAFQPTVTGMGAVLDALDGMVTTSMWSGHGAIVLVGLTYAMSWVFLSGGLVATYAAPDEPGSFFARAARAFPRFALIAVLAGALHALLLGVALPRLGDLVEHVNRETIDERVHFGWVVGKYAVVWAGVWLVATVAGYARALSVLEPDRSLPGTLVAAVRMVVRNAGAVFALSGLLLAGAIALLVVYAVIAPGAGDASWAGVIAALGLSQAFILARILVRCSFLACETSLARRLAARSGGS